MIHGVGPFYDRRIVRRFGKDVFDVLEKEPQRFRRIEGIGPIRAARLQEPAVCDAKEGT
jgi:exodeoxyribonuclease V alpha subunit